MAPPAAPTGRRPPEPTEVPALARTEVAAPARRAGGGPVGPIMPQRERERSRQSMPAPLPPSISSWSEPPRARPISTAPISVPGKVSPGRRVVRFRAGYPVGAIVVANRERALYHVRGDGTAVRYPVAIGSFTEEWTGLEIVTDKKVNPSWHPVVEAGKSIREPVAGGDPANPLGVRAIYLGRTLWRIHGTPAADSIGQAVSAGCIRMHNDHVVELYDQVVLGTEVYVVERLSDPAPAHRGRKIIE